MQGRGGIFGVLGAELPEQGDQGQPPPSFPAEQEIRMPPVVIHQGVHGLLAAVPDPVLKGFILLGRKAMEGAASPVEKTAEDFGVTSQGQGKALQSGVGASEIPAQVQISRRFPVTQQLGLGSLPQVPEAVGRYRGS
jgi:hypothetical protein